MAIWQSERDICYMFRNSKNPREQITILAELNSCTEEKIEDILKKNGLKIPAEKHKPQRQSTIKKWSVDDLVQLLYLISNGMNNQKLAKYFNRSEASIVNVRYKINIRQTATIRKALDIFYKSIA
jgi:hypothetical protein